MTDTELQQYYEDFFEDIFWEMNDKYGDIEEMNVCDNLGDHLVGNVYIMFREEEAAERAVTDLNNRWFAGKRARERPLYIKNRVFFCGRRPIFRTLFPL